MLKQKIPLFNPEVSLRLAPEGEPKRYIYHQNEIWVYCSNVRKMIFLITGILKPPMGKAVYFSCSAAFAPCQFLKSLFENHLCNRWESSIFGKQLLLKTVVESLHEQRVLVRNIVAQRLIKKLFYIFWIVCFHHSTDLFFTS